MSFNSAIKQFSKSNRGSVAITFGVAAIPLLIAAGMAIDYSRVISAKHSAQNALDGAALAAAAAYAKGDPDYLLVAQRYFDQNVTMDFTGSVPTVDITIQPDTQFLEASVNAKIKTTLLALAGTSEYDATLEATVSLPVFSDHHKGEIVLVLDYSGSMNWYLNGERKYKTMRTLAVDLVDSLSQNGTNNDVKFGLVPFSGEVLVNMKKKFWVNQGDSDTMYETCTRDRKGPFNTTDATPVGIGDNVHPSRWGHVPSNNPSNQALNCSSYSSRNLHVRELTSDHSGTVAQLQSMTTNGWTNISLGMEFGYHVLSPNEPFTGGSPYGAENAMKAVVLLTDGEQTSYSFGPGGGSTGSVANGESNLEAICENMKNDDIRVFTISYDLDDADTEARLEACASINPTTGQPDFFNADNGDQLAEAFGTITSQLARNIYLMK